MLAPMRLSSPMAGFPAMPSCSANIGPRPDRVLMRHAGTAIGDGLKMATDAGAALVGLDRFYGHLLSRDAMENGCWWPYPRIDVVATASIVVDQRGDRILDEGLGGISIANDLAGSEDPLGATVICDAPIWGTAGKAEQIPPNPQLLAGGGTRSFSAACARPLAGPSLWAMAGTLPEKMGDASRQPRSTAFLPEHIRIVGRMTRPPEQRPVRDTIDNISDWLLQSPRQLSEGIASFDEFAWRLVAAGMPLLRVTLHTATLHPQFLGTTITWWRDTGETVQVMIAHEVADAIPYEKNPVARVCYGRETLRRRLDLPDDDLDFEVLIELRERGGTDYIALPIDSVYAAAYMLTFVTDRPQGFSEDELADLARVGQRLSINVDRHNQWWITHNLLCAYLGANTGPKVLTGQIRRGAGMELTAVLWSSDLRGFTERSDRLPSERMIAILNALFEAQAAEIRGHGGEILKFIGDGLLAIFPIAEPGVVAAVANDALAAARNALAAVARLADHAALDGEPPLDIVVALHVGTVHYGNIGAADRLDFTVIGPAVNLVSRIENAAKMLGQPIVVSAELAAVLDGVLSLGRHPLRGLTAPQELFAPD
jgi:adenylate cyclase